MMEAFLSQCGKPRGLFAPLLLGLMNVGHKSFISSVLAEIPIEPSHTVLDIGCGGGNAVALLAKRARRVYGVDISPASVRRASAKNRRAIGEGRVFISQADAESLPFAEGTFDLITAFETIYFWGGLASTFKAIVSKLKPGGLFLAACEARRKDDERQNTFEKLSNGKMRVYSHRELRTIFEQSGFVSVTAYCEDKPRWLCLGGRRGADERTVSRKA